MSLFFGIFNRSGASVDPPQLDRMAAAVAHCPHRRSRLYLVDNFALGFLDTEPGETDPVFHSAQPPLVFAAAGRIDNRAELAAALGGPELAHACSDRELMFKAYLRWGERAEEKLLGDWAFIAFHPDEQRLFLSHDHHGRYALDYCSDPRRLLFSTNIHALLAVPDIPQRPDMFSVTRLLLLWPGDFGYISMYRDIRHVSPGCHLAATATDDAETRYWFPEHIEEVQETAGAQARAEHMRGLLDEVVGAQIRCPTATAATLSGGLDSGTVAYLAACRLAAVGERLTTFSHVPRFEARTRGRNGNEAPGILATAARAGNIDPILLDSAALSPMESIERMLAICQSPILNPGNAFWILDIASQAAASGKSDLLLGDLGNGTISYPGNPGALAARAWLSRPRLWPGRIRQRLRKQLRSGAPNLDAVKAQVERRSFINPALLTRSMLAELSAKSLFTADGSRWQSKRDEMIAIIRPGQNPIGYLHSLIGDHYGIRYSDPTADPRVVEYALSLPNLDFFGPTGERRYLVKRMMARDLPPQVLHPRRRGLQAADLSERLRDDSARLNELLERFSRSAAVSQLFDVRRLARQGQDVLAGSPTNALQCHYFLRAVMIGMFMLRFD